jgi:hypothetical protein
LLDLLPDAEVQGLLALMLLQDSRRRARTDAAGELVRLEDQDRTLWDRAMIAEGLDLVERAWRSGRIGPYVQAAIAAIHARARTPENTDWLEILALYRLLERIQPSPVVALNRAVALAMAEGPAAGLAAVDALLENGELARTTTWPMPPVPTCASAWAARRGAPRFRARPVAGDPGDRAPLSQAPPGCAANRLSQGCRLAPKPFDKEGIPHERGVRQPLRSDRRSHP